MARKSQRKHKKQQALQHIRGPQAEAFRQLTAGISPDQILVCPLDIGKNVHWGAFHTLDGQLLVEPMKLKTDLADFQTFVNCLDEQIATGRFKLVLMGHEPTGVYHETWARNLLTRYQGQLQGQTSPRMAYRFLNPYQVKLNRNQQVLRFRKTDLLDLGSIGDLLSRGFGYQAGMPSHDYLLIREEVRFLKSKAKELRRLENSIRTTFDHLWPGALGNAKRFSLTHPDLPPLQPLVKTRALERERVRVLIQHCPNPYRLRQLGVSGIRDLFRQHLGRGGDKTAAHILQVANSALLPPLDVTEAYADILQRDFSLYLQLETMIEHAQDQLAGLIPRTPARHLLAVAGAGPILLARYLATLGNPDRFLFADQVWSFAGFDPLTEESGDKKRIGKVSKSGDPYARDTLFLLGYQTARNEAYFGMPFLDTIERGKSEVEATLHTAHKVNRVFLHILQQDEPFDPPDIPDYQTYTHQFQARLARYLAQKKKAKKAKPNQGKRRSRPRPQATPRQKG
jgi:transposase